MTTAYDFLHQDIAEVDPDIADAIQIETQRQNDTLELIASENHVSRAVLKAMGSVFTNKYAEGYPGKRYYGGCGPTDVVETIAIERAKSQRRGYAVAPVTISLGRCSLASAATSSMSIRWVSRSTWYGTKL